MKRTLAAAGLIFILCATLVFAVNVNRETVEIHAIVPPLVNVAAIDFDGLFAEVAFGEFRIGEPVLKTTKSWCAPEHSKNKIKDAIELPTHYYEIPYEAASGVVVIRDAAGQVVYTDRLDSLESSQRFGYNKCRYWSQKNLEEDFAGKFITIERTIEGNLSVGIRGICISVLSGEEDTHAALRGDQLLGGHAGQADAPAEKMTDPD